MGRKHSLTVPGRYEHIQQICQFVADAAVQAGMRETSVFHVELACDEACTNIIEHAYGGEDIGDIQVHWQVEADAFIITISDNGRPFDPDKVPPPPIPTDVNAAIELPENLQAGGLGVYFMRKLMDDVQFYFSDTENTLVLVKKITPE